MDDDGLLLNISENTSEGVRQGKQKKGGRWTDRLKAKRTVKRKSQTVEEDGNVRKENSSGTGNILPPPHKKQRRDTQVDVNTVVSNSQSKSHPKQIVSSLFTSNPSVDTVKDIRHTQTPSKPSNAPLQDKSTFIGLGVDPLITTHLSSKMQILTPTTIQKEALPVLFMDPSDSSSTRDVFIQSQTGSGKTLSYLLPVIQDLLPLSSLSYIDRSIGTLAIIIAPTRELAKQISDVLEALLTMRLRASGETADDENSPHLTRWLVSGLLIGGATRTHEKARLRKGLPILVSTPGRLLDHLQNTSSFNVGKCRWLILDEADRLMELGFEDTLKQILQALDGRRKLALQAVEEGRSIEVSGWDWSRRRRTILCSATMKEDVQSLAGMVLVQPIIVKERPSDASSADSVSKAHAGGISQQNVAQEKFTPPSQLSQKYITVPLKLRLVTLIALLRSLLSLSRSSRGTKIIVFFSCTDSVDFHWMLFGNSLKEVKSEGAEEEQEDQSGEDTETNVIRRDSSFLPGASIYRLHGSLPLATRLTSLKEFSSVKPSSAPSASILFCTSVASRGLDLPLVRAVIQYDLPTEGGVNEYIHRVGRTARAGKGGEAWSFVSPSEKVWIDWINERLGKDKTSDQSISIRGENYATVLQSGFGGEGKQFEERATEIQMTLERWTSQNPRNIGLARNAFQSHVRAYATHPAEEKHIFHVRHLHLGHLAKAFALRDTPKDIASRNQKSSQKSSRRVKGGRTMDTETRPDLLDRSTKAESRMREIVRSQGKLNKKDGLMVTSGVSDFQVASVAELEKLVKQH